MNKHILKLALDSGLLNYVDNETPAHYFVYYNATGEDVQKFAELLIMECLTICEELGDKGMDGHYCADEIVKHFGVKV
mgnify:CR=1 FL=1